MTDLCRVNRRVFGDDVYGASNCRRPEKGRTTASHHFYSVNHIGRNLFQAINTGEGGKYRAGVHKYLGVMTVKAVDTYLSKAAVLTIILNSDSGLEI